VFPRIQYEKTPSKFNLIFWECLRRHSHVLLSSQSGIAEIDCITLKIELPKAKKEEPPRPEGRGDSFQDRAIRGSQLHLPQGTDGLPDGPNFPVGLALLLAGGLEGGGQVVETGDGRPEGFLDLGDLAGGGLDGIRVGIGIGFSVSVFQ